jgi:hypothetical protein
MLLLKDMVQWFDSPFGARWSLGEGWETYTRLNIKGKPVGTLLHEERQSKQCFYKNATFYSFNELKVIMRKNELTVINSCSTIFQKPTEKPLRFEAPRRGCYGKTGFVAVKAGKKLPPASI